MDVALGAIAVLAALNLAGVQRVIWYVLVGIVLWVFVLKSGVHATLAGVALALAIPFKTRLARPSPLVRIEHELAPWVGFGILPLFGFANAGLPFSGLSVSSIVEPLPLGIAAPCSSASSSGFSARQRWRSVAAGLPKDASWFALYGTSILTGIGFTMSLFIGTLAFGESDREAPMRLGVLVGSALAALAGAAVLSFATRGSSRASRSAQLLRSRKKSKLANDTAQT